MWPELDIDMNHAAISQSVAWRDILFYLIHDVLRKVYSYVYTGALRTRTGERGQRARRHGNHRLAAPLRRL